VVSGTEATGPADGEGGRKKLLLAFEAAGRGSTSSGRTSDQVHNNDKNSNTRNKNFVNTFIDFAPGGANWQGFHHDKYEGFSIEKINLIDNDHDHDHHHFQHPDHPDKPATTKDLSPNFQINPRSVISGGNDPRRGSQEGNPIKERTDIEYQNRKATQNLIDPFLNSVSIAWDTASNFFLGLGAKQTNVFQRGKTLFSREEKQREEKERENNTNVSGVSFLLPSKKNLFENDGLWKSSSPPHHDRNKFPPADDMPTIYPDRGVGAAYKKHPLQNQEAVILVRLHFYFYFFHTPVAARSLLFYIISNYNTSPSFKRRGNEIKLN